MSLPCYSEHTEVSLFPSSSSNSITCIWARAKDFCILGVGDPWPPHVTRLLCILLYWRDADALPGPDLFWILLWVLSPSSAWPGDFCSHCLLSRPSWVLAPVPLGGALPRAHFSCPHSVGRHPLRKHCSCSFRARLANGRIHNLWSKWWNHLWRLIFFKIFKKIW